jgi:hypothetical protein
MVSRAGRIDRDERQMAQIQSTLKISRRERLLDGIDLQSGTARKIRHQAMFPDQSRMIRIGQKGRAENLDDANRYPSSGSSPIPFRVTASTLPRVALTRYDDDPGSIACSLGVAIGQNQLGGHDAAKGREPNRAVGAP